MLARNADENVRMISWSGNALAGGVAPEPVTEEGLWTPPESCLVKADPDTRLYRLPWGSGQAFLKIYSYSPWWVALRARGFESRARREARVLEELARRGIPAPVLLACGEEDRGPLRTRSLLLTVNVEGAESFEDRLIPLWKAAERAPVFVAAAAALRRMHEAGFLHGNLFTRNLMVPARGSPLEAFPPLVLDAPWGCFFPGPVPWERRADDLACFLHFKHPAVSRAELLRFVRLYLGRPRGQGLGEEGRALARRILRSTAWTRSVRKRLVHWWSRRGC